MPRIGTVADGCGGCLLRVDPRKSFLAPFSGLLDGASVHGIFSARLTSSDMCSGHRPAGIPLKGAFHLQPRNGDTDRSPQPRYMRVRQGQALVTPRTWDMAKTTRPACAKSPASRNASRRRVKFCRRRFPRDGSDRLALELVGRMPSTRNRLAGRVAAIGHGGKGRSCAWRERWMIEVCSGGPSKDNRNNGSENVKVYQAINKVQAALAKSGITKDKRNQQQGYNFRGIDDVYNALAPLLAEHGLCILPRVLSRHCDERQTAKGSAIFYVTVEAEFDFVCAEDGSKHTVKTFGEAMDSADKATNKAMSAAYKYAAFQAFAIPTEADNDADAHTHQVQPRQAPPVDPGAIEKAVQWIAASKSIDVAKHRGMSAISRFTDPQDHERINAAVTEYEQAAMAGA